MKKVFIFGVAALLMLGAVGYFLVTGPRDAAPVESAGEVASSTPVEAQESEILQGRGSLNSLLLVGRALECSIEYQSAVTATSTTGTYFTARGMLRGDFMVPEMATGSVSSLIVRDNTLYTWSVIEGETYGMKVDLAALEGATVGESRPDTREPVPLEAEVSYTCRPWAVVDGSIFEPPADVLFTNYADILNMGMEVGTIYEEGTTDNSVQCELCEQVEGEGKVACKAQFRCE